MWIITLIIFFIIISFYYYINKYKSNKTIEGYDDRHIDTSLIDCAEFCKTTENCNGFGYDPINKICYPSQLIISGRPLEAIFKDDYLYTNVTCNKPFPIVSSNETPSFVERRNNSLYVCRGAFDLHPKYYFFNHRQFIDIGEGKNLDEIATEYPINDKIQDVEFYKVNSYNWPINRFEYTQKDLLFNEIENVTFNNKRNITDLNRIIQNQNKS